MIDHNALWNPTSSVWLVVFGIAAIYAIAFRPLAGRQIGVLTIGLSLLVLAFVSPIGVLADGYLFSAHIVQHLLLLLVVPLCLLLALPNDLPTLLSDRFSRIRIARLPVVCWLAGVGAMWLWHVPTLCDAAAQTASLGLFRDVSFLTAGLVFWWPIYSPVTKFRLPPLRGIAYLFSACLGCTLLGIYLTFTTVSVCPAFANPADRIGIMTRLYDAGLTPGIDQHIGGLLMWVPPCMLYVGSIIGLLGRWYSTTECVTESLGTRSLDRSTAGHQEESLAI